MLQIKLAFTVLLCAFCVVGLFIPLDCEPFEGKSHALIVSVLLALNLVPNIQ